MVLPTLVEANQQAASAGAMKALLDFARFSINSLKHSQEVKMIKTAVYVRVSRVDLNPENQLLELKQYVETQGWEYEVFTELESTRKTRPIKTEVFNRACRGEFKRILVWKIDRWARSLQELINDFNQFRMRKVEFISLRDNITLNDDPRNMLMIQIIGAFAEFEREMIRERTLAGLERAKAQGKTLGRPFGAKDKRQRRTIGYFKQRGQKSNA